jgi:ATP/ADP translocase
MANAEKKAVRAVAGATIAAAATIAQQVVGKATRDAMFLSRFSAKDLPFAMIAGAIVSAGVIAVMTASMRKRGPFAVVPSAFTIHAFAALVEWGASFYFDRAIAVIVYIHTASVGATIVSAFWSVVSEAFDPHTAKQVVGRIGAGATLGGVFGGAIAWFGARIATIPTMLVVIAVLSLVCAWGVRVVREETTPDSRPEASAKSSGFGTLRDTPYLQLLAFIVLGGAVIQSLIEYALGTEATRTYSGERLLSFFAVFQTAIGVLSFLLQLSLNRFALEKLGVGPTLALLPVGVVALGGVALGLPSLLTLSLQRGAEGVLRASLFRSAYEVLFAPVPPAAKRAAKTVIDVGFDRLGMIAGSCVTLAIIAWSPWNPVRAVTIAAMGFAVLQIAVARRLQRGYVLTLAERLRSGAFVLADSEAVDLTTKNTLSQTTRGLDRSLVLAQIEALRKSSVAATPRYPDPDHPEIEMAATGADDRVRILGDLRSNDDKVVMRALDEDPETLAPLAYEVLELLGRDAVAKRARKVLKPLVPRLVGTIMDLVLDERRDLAARRRAARLLGGAPSQRAADSLTMALDSADLGVRYAAGHALLRMREKEPDLRFDYYAMRARARKELELRDAGATDPRHLEHAFNLLSLVFPAEPMQLAYGALSGDDPVLRGIALEYLEVVLPPADRAAFARSLEQIEAPRTSLVPNEKALEQLVEKRTTIRKTLAAARRAHDDAGA